MSKSVAQDYYEFGKQTVGFARVCREARSVIVDFPYTPLPPLMSEPKRKWRDVRSTKVFRNLTLWDGGRGDGISGASLDSQASSSPAKHPRWLCAEIASCRGNT